MKERGGVVEVEMVTDDAAQVHCEAFEEANCGGFHGGCGSPATALTEEAAKGVFYLTQVTLDVYKWKKPRDDDEQLGDCVLQLPLKFQRVVKYMKFGQVFEAPSFINYDD
ncbi:hypothetical protein Bca4012_011204 [Brassica carinata]